MSNDQLETILRRIEIVQATVQQIVKTQIAIGEAVKSIMEIQKLDHELNKLKGEIT